MSSSLINIITEDDGKTIPSIFRYNDDKKEKILKNINN
jgi:hypothetical protein